LSNRRGLTGARGKRRNKKEGGTKVGPCPVRQLKIPYMAGYRSGVKRGGRKHVLSEAFGPPDLTGGASGVVDGEQKKERLPTGSSRVERQKGQKQEVFFFQKMVR